MKHAGVESEDMFGPVMSSVRRRTASSRLVIERPGGENIGAQLTSEWAQISSEELVAANPSIILLGDALYGVTVESVAARAGWDSSFRR